MFEFDKVISQIDFEYEYGIRDFEITGGEPSEFAQLRELCQYIKHKDKDSKIAIITNGGLWKSDVWDLIDEVLVSYHLGRESTCNKEMFPLGCTYDKVKKTVDKARANNVLVRSNTVLATFNIDGLDSILEDLVTLQPSIVNFLPVNLFDQASSMAQYIDYSVLRTKLKYAIDMLKEKLPQSLVFVRYMPFCGMEGYEQHIVGNLQHIFDWFDWNRELDGTVVLDMIADKNASLAKLGRYGSTSISHALALRNIYYTKPDCCMKCKYFLVCDGVEKNEALLKYIQPAKGRIEPNILHYLQDTYPLYCKLYKN